ncbi:ring finger protein-like [Grus americana]|uniref:ring finger protein-like n=1 Tax=Grus americana TaxID=9117 RepID=UPI002407CFF2|nr:ring finger protein-like [Grus americana]
MHRIVGSSTASSAPGHCLSYDTTVSGNGMLLRLVRARLGPSPAWPTAGGSCLHGCLPHPHPLPAQRAAPGSAQLVALFSGPWRVSTTSALGSRKRRRRRRRRKWLLDAHSDAPLGVAYRESPAPRGASRSLESASSSILSLSGEEEETSSSEVVAEPCCVPAGSEDECPICTEPYDDQQHKPALLNCNHGLCRACLRAIMDTAAGAEFGRVRCPICRQKTPMLEWEICKLQEELLLLHAQPTSPGTLTTPRPPALPPRRPGLTGALEHRFQVRFHTSRMFGCLPCIRYPPCLIHGLGRLERRCRCCYLLVLVLLLVAEMLSLLLIFLPIVLMVMLFLILDK